MFTTCIHTVFVVGTYSCSLLRKTGLNTADNNEGIFSTTPKNYTCTCLVIQQYYIHDRQRKYNVILRCVHETIVTEEKQCVTYFVCVITRAGA